MVNINVSMFVKEICLTVTLSRVVYAAADAVTKPRSVSFAELVINQFLLIESREPVRRYMNFT